MSGKAGGEERDGVALTNLDQPLFDGADATKRDLVDYFDAIRDRILPVLEDRPLSVIRVHRGQEAFMQKNVPKYTPDVVPTVPMWAESSKREVSLRALQRSPHTALVREPTRGRVPPDALHGRAARPRHASRSRPRPARQPTRSRWSCASPISCDSALADVGLEGAVKTSGAKGVHVFVPDRHRNVRGLRRGDPRHRRPAPSSSIPAIATTAFIKDDRGGKVFVDSTRVGGATVICAYSPRVRPGVPVSFPVAWDDLDERLARATSPCTTRWSSWATATPGPSTCLLLSN